MRHLLTVAAFALLVPLAACGGGDAPTAPATPAATETKAPAAAAPVKPAAAPAAPAKVANKSLAPMFGSWAPDPASCSAPVLITETSYSNGQTSCEITGWADNADGTFKAAISCSGKAQNLTITPLFGPQGEGVRVAGSGDPVIMFRCKAQ